MDIQKLREMTQQAQQQWMYREYDDLTQKDLLATELAEKWYPAVVSQIEKVAKSGLSKLIYYLYQGQNEKDLAKIAAAERIVERLQEEMKFTKDDLKVELPSQVWFDEEEKHIEHSLFLDIQW